ncbi:hypothetical protein [Ornithinimicrobium kibberense]
MLAQRGRSAVEGGHRYVVQVHAATVGGPGGRATPMPRGPSVGP